MARRGCDSRSAAIGLRLQLGIALIGPERVAAGGHIVDRLVEILAGELAVGPGARDFRDRARRAGTARHRPGPGCAGPARRASAPWDIPCPEHSPRAACSAASHSSTSKRLDGTSSASLGRSSRWLERPIRCSRRLDPLGAPTWITRSTSPQSMPSSSVEVQTTARSRPSAIAASTLRRWPTSSEP